MPDTLSANQLVAHNLMRARKMLGLNQEEAAARLEPYLGAKWSKAVYSAAERSYHGKRVRQFTADDLVAFSLAFGVPVIYFFLPPRAEDRTIGAGAGKQEVTGVGSGKTDIVWRDLFEVMVGGPYRASVLHRKLELPVEDRPALNSDTDMAIMRLALNPPAGQLGWMSVPGPEDDADQS